MTSSNSSKQDLELYIELLKDKDSQIRIEAADVLGELANEQAVEPLMEALKSDHWRVREHAALALCKIGDKGPLALFAVIEDDTTSSIIQDAAEFGLKQLKNTHVIEPFITKLRSNDSEERYDAAVTLSIAGKVGLVALINALKDNNAEVRDAALWGLRHSRNSEATDPLITIFLNDENSTVRRHAAEALRFSGDERATKPLIEVLKSDRDNRVRYNAIRTLNEYGGEEVDEAMIEALNDNDAEVRAKAMEYLGVTRNQEALNPLIKGLQDKEWEVRNAAAYALGEIGNPDMIEPLLNVIIDENKYVRANVVEALGKLKAEQAIPSLKKIEESDSYEVARREAAKAIKMIEQGKAS